VAKFDARLYGVYLAPDNHIQFCAIEPGMMRGQVLVRDLRGSKHAAVAAERILHLFTLDKHGEGSVYPFIRLRPTVEAVAVEREAVRLAANIALPPVQMPLQAKGEEFHMATGYDAPRKDMLELRRHVPGLDVIRATFLFTVISANRGNGECENIYYRLWPHIADGSLRKMSEERIKAAANTPTSIVTIWGKPGLTLGDYMHSVWDWAEDFAKWWAAHPKLRDRELRRRAAMELGLPKGLGFTKFAFGLELLGHNVCCLDKHILGILVGSAKTAKEARAIGEDLAAKISQKGSPPEGSRWKAIVPKSIDLYEEFEDLLVKDNEFFDPQDPMSYARCQWMTWEVLRNEATMHDSLFASIRSLKSDLKIHLHPRYLESLKRGAKMIWMRLRWTWVDVRGEKPVTVKAREFAKRAKKRISTFRYATPRLIANPVTTKSLSLASGPWAEYAQVHDASNSWMRAIQVPDALRQAVLRVLYRNKPPEVRPDVVGEGAFAVVTDHPHDRKLVVKLTSDALDADLASRIKFLQDRGDKNALAVFPVVHEIYEVPYSKEGIDERPTERFWAMVIERVVPLREAAETMLGSEGQHLLDGLVKWSRHAPAMEVANELAWKLERGEVKARQKEQVAEALRKGLVGFVAALGKAGESYKDKYNGKLTDTMRLMQDVVGSLLEMGFYITDLHCSNWGVRVTTGQMLVIDFGLSSTEPADKTARTKTLLKVKPAAKQLSLFPKRNPEGWTSYTKRGYCELCHREPVEVFERRGWPNLCAVCIPKWEAHVKRTAAEEELFGKYMDYIKSTGRIWGYSSIEQRDRAKAKFIEDFEGGKNYIGKKGFEEWLKREPTKNPLPYKVIWRVEGRWQANMFQSMREAQAFFERVKHWPGSSQHRIIDARTGAMLIMANPRQSPPSLRKKVLVVIRRYGPISRSAIASKTGASAYHVDRAIHSLWYNNYVDTVERISGKRKWPRFDMESDKWTIPASDR